MEEKNYAAMSDEELSEEIKNQQKKRPIGKIIYIIGLIGSAIIIVDVFAAKSIPYKQMILGTIICVAVMLAGLKISSDINKNIKKIVGPGILRAALENVFDDVNYSPLDYISSSDVHSAGFYFNYNEVGGHDHVYAKYKGLNVEMSEITLVDDDAESRTIIFRGLWLICDFGKEITADVRIMERGKLGKMLGKLGIKTDNEQFNKQFYIESNNAEEVFHILTPHMMEYIVQMDAKADVRTNLSFMKNGKLHIALNSGRDSFAVKGGNYDAAKIREQFVNEIRHITDLIDELRITDGIFKE